MGRTVLNYMKQLRHNPDQRHHGTATPDCTSTEGLTCAGLRQVGPSLQDPRDWVLQPAEQADAAAVAGNQAIQLLN